MNMYSKEHPNYETQVNSMFFVSSCLKLISIINNNGSLTISWGPCTFFSIFSFSISILLHNISFVLYTMYQAMVHHIVYINIRCHILCIIWLMLCHILFYSKQTNYNTLFIHKIYSHNVILEFDSAPYHMIVVKSWRSLDKTRLLDGG